MPIAYATTKLTEDDVVEIRVKRDQGWSRADLAQMFEVSETTIDDVTSRRTWKNVA